MIDPFIRPVTLPPFGSVSQSTGYTVPINCTATGLVVTVDILQNGNVVATRSAELRIMQIA